MKKIVLITLLMSLFTLNGCMLMHPLMMGDGHHASTSEHEPSNNDE